MVDAESERANAINQRGKLRIAGPQVLHRLVGIERKFAATAVVNHGRSLPQAAAWLESRVEKAATERHCKKVNVWRESRRPPWVTMFRARGLLN